MAQNYNLQIVIANPENCTKCKEKMQRVSDTDYACAVYLREGADTSGHTYVRVLKQ